MGAAGGQAGTEWGKQLPRPRQYFSGPETD